MFVYCIKPGGDTNCNFVKIGYCSNIESIKKRYTTPYGSNFIYHFINIDTIKGEKIIHNRLKYLKLHLENELFLFNEKYNFLFYVKELKKLELDFKEKLEDYILTNKLNTELDKKIHVFDFLGFFLNKFIINSKIEYYKNSSNYYKKYHKIFKYNNEFNFNFLYSEYLLFCYKISQQVCKNKDKLKENIILIKSDNYIHYKGNYFMINLDIIKIETRVKISSKEYIKKIYNIEIEEKDQLIFEKYMVTKDIEILLNISFFHDKIEITYDILIKIRNYIGFQKFIEIRYNIVSNTYIEKSYYNLINDGDLMNFIFFVDIETLYKILKDHNMKVIRNTSGKTIYILIMYKKNIFHKSCYMYDNDKLYILWKKFSILTF